MTQYPHTGLTVMVEWDWYKMPVEVLVQIEEGLTKMARLQANYWLGAHKLLLREKREAKRNEFAYPSARYFEGVTVGYARAFHNTLEERRRLRKEIKLARERETVVKVEARPDTPFGKALDRLVGLDKEPTLN